MSAFTRLLVVALFAAFSSVLATNGHTAQRVLVLGAVHDDPNSLYAAMKPIADYVRDALQPYGIESVEILIVPNRSKMVNLMRDGRIDWVSETAFGAVYLQQRTKAEFLARKWKDGAATYHSVFFTRKDNDIERIEDLRNRIVAFEHRNSTSAFFMPASMMSQRELPLDGLATPRETPRDGAFGYVYSGNEYNTAIWVHKGLVDAGVLSNTDWKNRDILPKKFVDELVVFARSEELPRAVEVVRQGIDPVIKKRLFEVLSNMHDDPAANKALAAFHGTARFDALTQQDLTALNHIRDALPAFAAQFP